jgi:hypothetical protein
MDALGRAQFFALGFVRTLYCVSRSCFLVDHHDYLSNQRPGCEIGWLPLAPGFDFAPAPVTLQMLNEQITDLKQTLSKKMLWVNIAVCDLG